MAAVTRCGRTAGEQPRPHEFDTFNYAALEYTRREVSQQKTRQLLGAASLAVDSMLLNGDLHPYGITDDALLGETSDHLGEEKCPKCGGQKVRGSAGEPTDGSHSANNSDATASSADASRDSTPKTAHDEKAAAKRSAVTAACHCETTADDDAAIHAATETPEDVEHSERLFELTSSDEDEADYDSDNSTDCPAEPDSFGYADYIPFRSESVPVNRIIKLLRHHAGGAVPCGLYEGTWRKIGLSIGHCLDISGRSAETFIATSLAAVLGLPKLTQHARQGVIDFRKLDFAASKTAHLAMDELTQVDDAL